MKRLLLIVSGLVLLFSTTATPAAAFTPSWDLAHLQPNSTVWWCPSSGTPGTGDGDSPTEYTQDLIEWALDASWDYYTDIDFVRKPVGYCSGNDVIVRIYDQAAAMSTSWTPNPLGGVLATYVNIDPIVFTKGWLSTSYQTGCIVTGTSTTGCKMDFVAMVNHEFGHVIGFNHQGSPTLYCASGYAANQWGAACSGIGDGIMYWASGAEWTNVGGPTPHQGYRHGIDSSELNAVNIQF